MENQKYKEMFHQSGACPASDLLWDYAHGKMNDSSTRGLENHLVHCALCAGAVEGYSIMNSPAALNDIAKKNPYNSTNIILDNAKVIFVVIGIIAIIVWWFSKENVGARVDDFKKVESVESSNSNIERKSKVEVVDRNSMQAIESGNQKQLPIKPQINHSKDRWKDELFTIEKKEIKLASGTQVKLEIKDRLSIPIIYLHNLKVMNFTKKYAVDPQLFEVYSSLHPRYANPNEKGIEQIYSDVDTVLYQDLLASAMENFSRGSYKRCVEQLSVILEKYPNDDNALFYAGLANAELNDLKGSIGLLKKLSVQSKSAFYEEANWHLALTYLKGDNLKEGNDRLLKIAEGKGFYSSQAKELLRK
jgi:hypothetical protein